MKVPEQNRRTKVGFNMTPMIDVVFLLIIFFLVSSHLARTENNKKLSLPVAESAEDQKPVPRVTINVVRDGSIYVSGRRTDAGSLVNILNDVRQDKGDDLEVRIRISKLATYGAAEPIMLACTRAKVWNVSFAAYRVDQESN